MPSQRRINQALGSLEPAAARAFREAIDGARSRAQVAELVAAIEARDIDRALRAAGITSATWVSVTETARRAYIEGGNLTAADAPARLGFEFDLNNPRAQQWLAGHSSEFVTRINNDQREAIRAVLAAGFEQGRNPRSIALDIVGRIDRATKRRAGGIVGLTQQMAGYVTNARQQLGNLDPAYLTRKRRDRRFDRLVQRAINDGTPLSAVDIDRITGRYADRLLQLRGENIGRTEVLGSLNQGRNDALRQAVDDGLITEENIQRVWRTAMDERTRDSHADANGQVVGLNEPFVVGGVEIQYPGDFDAPPEEVINCRCIAVEQVDWASEL